MLLVLWTPIGPVVLTVSLAILLERVQMAFVVDSGSVGLPLPAQEKPVLSTALGMLHVG